MARTRHPYIPETTGPVDTFVQTSGVVFMFGGMLLTQWLMSNAIVGLVIGTVLFAAVTTVYVISPFRSSTSRSETSN